MRAKIIAVRRIALCFYTKHTLMLSQLNQNRYKSTHFNEIPNINCTETLPVAMQFARGEANRSILKLRYRGA